MHERHDRLGVDSWVLGAVRGIADTAVPGAPAVENSATVGREPTIADVPTLRVSELRISKRTADKLLKKHGIHEDQVRAAVEGVGGLTFTWHDHAERGRRAIIETQIDGKRSLVVLYPVALEYSEIWNLGSAYTVEP